MQWIDRREPGLHELSPEERDEITHFLFLWMIFEAWALHTHASIARIRRAAKRWAEAGLLDSDPFAEHLTYFGNRYIRNGELTPRFDGLNLRDQDTHELVETVLRSGGAVPQNIATVVLIIDLTP